MTLTNNYYREVTIFFGMSHFQTFFEFADAIGFLKEDLNAQNLDGRLNLLREQVEVNDETQVPLQNKLGGRRFCEVFVFTLATSATTMDVLFVGSVVSDCG